MSGVGADIEKITSGASIGVDVPAIERELAAMWREVAKDEQHQITRACLWNLVFWTERQHFARVKALVNAISPACPARAIVLSIAPGDEPGEAGKEELSASVEANCNIAPDGRRLLCSEEITLEARGRGEEHLPSLVRALQVPDVPVAIVWAGQPPTDKRRVERLLGGADRLIIDTGDLASSGDLGDLCELSQIASEVDVADLGWLRQGAFRGLLAGIFDAPIGSAPLRRIARARLDANRHGAATAQLLLGWLASRLDWGKPVRKGGEAKWRASYRGGEVEIEIVVRDVEAGRDGIYQILLETDRGERYAITDSPASGEWLDVEATGRPTCTVASPDAARSDAELLVAALGGRGHDPLFELALARAAELA